jgi:hypothetical protein
MVETIGISRTFFFYAAMCGLGLVISYFFVPETKNISLETIEHNIRAQRPLRRIGMVNNE